MPLLTPVVTSSLFTERVHLKCIYLKLILLKSQIQSQSIVVVYCVRKHQNSSTGNTFPSNTFLLCLPICLQSHKYTLRASSTLLYAGEPLLVKHTDPVAHCLHNSSLLFHWSGIHCLYCIGTNDSARSTTQSLLTLAISLNKNSKIPPNTTLTPPEFRLVFRSALFP
jgi:hypothetical protein